MSHYLKERFAEYRAIEKDREPKKPKPAIKPDQEDLYVDFEITYQGTDIIVESFSMTKKEIAKDFRYALIHNLSDVLEVNKGNIRLLSQKGDTTVCEVTYSGKTSEYIKLEITKITDRPAETHLVDADIYNDLDEEPEPVVIGAKMFNPYTDCASPGKDWFCVCCGFMLMPISPMHEMWGELAWDVMKDHKTQWYLCTNKTCVHAQGPLVLHDPQKGWMKPSDGKSYSLSWVR